MNPDNTIKKKCNKFFSIVCCARSQKFTSDEVIFDYFGKEFTEYEYVIENLAIRPAPKKLLDLVPVHSTYTDKSIICKVSTDNTGKPAVTTSTCTQMSQNQKPNLTGEGDFKNSKTNALKIQDENDGFISFKTSDLDGAYNEGRNLKPYNPHDYRPDPRTIKDIKELRKTIKTTEYRTPKQLSSRKIITDLYEASENSLDFKLKTSLSNQSSETKPIPREIKTLIESLRFKKPPPQFYTRTEKKLSNNTQTVYLSQIRTGGSTGNKNYRSPELEQQSKDEDSDVSLGINSNDRAHYTVDNTAQTEISKACSCPKKDKKDLKWKIIINKHAKKP